MGIPELSLRFRIFLFFAFLMVSTIVVIASAIYMAQQSTPEQLPRLLATYTGVATVIIVLVLLLVWQLFDRYVAAALQSLARQMQTVLHADAMPDEKGLRNREPYQYLGPVSDAADELIQAYQHIKYKSGSSQVEHDIYANQTSQLATIIRDLDVGLLVMNCQYEIVLYNQRALRTICRPECLGLARNALRLFEGTDLQECANQLIDQTATTDLAPTVGISLKLANQVGCLTGKMSPIISDDHRVTGYVLLFEDLSPATPATSFSGAHVSKPAELNSQVKSIGLLPSRPEFFDVGLLDRSVCVDKGAQNLRFLDYVVFDTETTGLSPSGGDQMISIAAVRIVNGRVLTGECFNEMIQPGIPVPASSTVFHGITDAMLEGKPSIKEILPQFAEFAEDAVLVAHNAAFDMKFIELQSENCLVKLENPVLDTVVLSAFVHDHTQKHTLEDLAERYGIVIEGRHTALGDALATARVFVKLIGQLSCRKVHTLDDALNASNRMTHIKRHQRRY